ncbi:hypothetical protein [Anaerovibrio sp.]|uniref:tetratricopeptide repeat protein n=1 Tax=Anaerovibrio sp. TaxID=1872532 RepID=UPI0025C3E96B|nr:hypothetical protein [Anaerovibrio sp.]
MKKIVSLLILVACFFSVGFVNNQKCSAGSVSWLLASTGHDEYNKGHYEDAIRLLNEALPGLNDASSKPQRQKALCWLGDTYAVGYNNYEKAIEYYNQAISIDVRNKYTPVMYSDRGTSNLRLGNYEKAIYEFL